MGQENEWHRRGKSRSWSPGGGHRGRSAVCCRTDHARISSTDSHRSVGAVVSCCWGKTTDSGFLCSSAQRTEKGPVSGSLSLSQVVAAPSPIFVGLPAIVGLNVYSVVSHKTTVWFQRCCRTSFLFLISYLISLEVVVVGLRVIKVASHGSEHSDSQASTSPPVALSSSD